MISLLERTPDPSTNQVTVRSQPPLGWLPEVTVFVAIGTVLVALAYAESRRGAPMGLYLYWAGELFMFVPAFSVLCLRRSIGVGEAFGICLALALGTYLVKVAYSPLTFKFPDELEHWRTTKSILLSHHLFGANATLPISPRYPGLESLTAMFSSATTLSVTISGFVVAGVARILGMAALFSLVREFGGSIRFAGIAATLYATSWHFQFFDAMYSYETLALPFLILTLLAAFRASSAERFGTEVLWVVVAIGCGGVVVVTHHVTSYALLISLLLLVFANVSVRRWKAAGSFLVVTVFLILGTGLWVNYVAPGTLDYLHTAISEVSQAFTSIFGHRRTRLAGTGPTGPVVDHAFTYVAVAITILGLAIGCYAVLRRRHRGGMRRHIGPVVAITAVLGYLGVLAVRALVSDGPELAGRILTFVFVPVCAVLAQAAEVLRRWRRRAKSGVAVVITGGTLLFVGGITSGWPPAWERLPHSYLVDGFESSVSAQGVAASRWAYLKLGQDNRFAVDSGNYSLIGSIGWQVPVRDLGMLYLTKRWTRADTQLVKKASVQFIFVDLRLSQQLPESGEYFPVDPPPPQPKSLIPPSDLQKFEKVSGIARVYDNGVIKIYSALGLIR